MFYIPLIMMNWIYGKPLFPWVCHISVIWCCDDGNSSKVSKASATTCSYRKGWDHTLAVETFGPAPGGCGWVSWIIRNTCSQYFLCMPESGPEPSSRGFLMTERCTTETPFMWLTSTPHALHTCYLCGLGVVSSLYWIILLLCVARNWPIWPALNISVKTYFLDKVE